MKKSLAALSVSALITACGGSGSAGPGTQDNTATPGLGAALPEQVSSNTIEVSRDFGFATARTVDIDFDIPNARNDEASVSVCTDFDSVGAEYDIDFNSCTVSGNLEAGTFNKSMEVTNDKASVVAVVLFQDAELPPLYKEFSIDVHQRGKSDGSVQRVIVWR